VFGTWCGTQYKDSRIALEDCLRQGAAGARWKGFDTLFSGAYILLRVMGIPCCAARERARLQTLGSTLEGAIMAEAGKPKDQKTQEAKPEAVQKVDHLPQPRELTPEELAAVAGGPWVINR